MHTLPQIMQHLSSTLLSLTVQGRMHLASSLTSSGSSTSSVSQGGSALDVEDPTANQKDSISPAHSPATSTSESDTFAQVFRCRLHPKTAQPN